MEKFIPATGETGFFRLADPFAIPESEVYTCKAIRTISELISMGMDPFVLYYQPKGLGADVFERHEAMDMEIISLQNDGGHWVHVPAAYILGYPNMNGIPYRSLAFTVMLPAFPLDQPFDHVKTQLKEVVQMSLGVDSVVKQVVTSKTKLIDSDSHQQNKLERFQLSKGTTPTAQAAYWKNAYESLKQQFDALVESMQ